MLAPFRARREKPDFSEPFAVADESRPRLRDPFVKSSPQGVEMRRLIMAVNLVALVTQFLTPDMMARIASALGLDPSAAQKAIGDIDDFVARNNLDVNDFELARRAIFSLSADSTLALGIAVVSLRKTARERPPRFSLAGFSRGYGSVFANPRAKVCFGAVFTEGIVIFGVFPFVALLLLAAGEPRASIAGAVIAGFSCGGVIYALTVPRLVRHWRPDQLMIGGGAVAAVALSIVAFDFAWPVQLAAFTLLGFGFYTLHGSIQVQATELSADARGAAMSLHSFFFFMGHASGPVLYGLGFSTIGALPALMIAAAVIMTVGLVCSRLLRERTGT